MHAIYVLPFVHRKAWTLVKEESTFIDWQRAKVQETTDEVSPEHSSRPKMQLVPA